jgi:preprotein translocase subunit SecF
MSVLTRMYRGETHFDFVGIAKKTLLVSAALAVLSLLALLIRPLNLSIDFTGGVIVTVQNESGADITEVRSALADIGEAGARVQLTGEGFILIQTESLDAASQDELITTAADVAGVPVNDVTLDAVGPTFGEEVTRAAIEALVVFLVIVALFITWRFEWKMALAALAALFHDLVITAGLFSVTGFSVTPATVIALLTILGYSLYDTVVVFDKVTENVEMMHDRYTYTEIVNTSMNQVLMRSINTSLTSLIPVGTLLFVGSFAFGAHTLREFALALFIGIAIGTFSSIFVAAPLLGMWKEREPEWITARKRAARRRSGGGASGRDQETAATVDTSPEAVPAPVPAAPVAPSAPTGAAPRPPRKRKKRR